MEKHMHMSEADADVVWVVPFRGHQQGPGPCWWVEEGPALPARGADLHPVATATTAPHTHWWGAVRVRLAGDGDRKLAGWTGGAYRLHRGRPYPPAPEYAGD